MKYSIKPKNDSDKENAKQLELIMNHKLATYDDISEVIKERVDNFEFDDQRGISIQSINQMAMHAVMPSVISGLNHNIIIADDIELAKMREPSFSINRNPFYPRSYASKDTVEIINAILFQKQKQPKENHPHGWYRKFDKKRNYHGN